MPCFSFFQGLSEAENALLLEVIKLSEIPPNLAGVSVVEYQNRRDSVRSMNEKIADLMKRTGVGLNEIKAVFQK